MKARRHTTEHDAGDSDGPHVFVTHADISQPDTIPEEISQLSVDSLGFEDRNGTPETLHSSVCHDLGDTFRITDQEKQKVPEQISSQSTASLVSGVGGGSNTNGRTLNKSLRNALHPVGGKRYLPSDELARLVSPASVRHELKSLFKQLSPPDVARYTDEICHSHTYPDQDPRKTNKTSRQRIFAILCLIEKLSHILEFVDEGLYDSDLPLVKQHHDDPNSRDFEFRKRSAKDKPLTCFSMWTDLSLDLFHEYQWYTQSPYFSRADIAGRAQERVLHYPLEDGVVLPFIEDKERNKGPGDPEDLTTGFSTVSKVVIHPAHHNFESPSVSSST